MVRPPPQPSVAAATFPGREKLGGRDRISDGSPPCGPA